VPLLEVGLRTNSFDLTITRRFTSRAGLATYSRGVWWRPYLEHGPAESRAVRLLLASARTPNAPSSECIDALLPAGADWPSFIDLARVHGVLPLVYRTLVNAQGNAVPDAVMDELRCLYQLNAASNHALTQSLFELLELLGAASVPCVPFKGPSLAVTGYEDLALRSFSDLDVFVRREHVATALEQLLAHGFTSVNAEPGRLSGHPLRTEHHVSLLAPNALDIELHWAIAPKFFLETDGADDWWLRIRDVKILGRAVPCFSFDDQLLLLSIHGSKHLWARLAWVCDVAELLRRAPDEIAWDDLLARARRLGAERMLFLALELARSLLQAPVPHVLGKAIDADRNIVALARTVRRVMFDVAGLKPNALAPGFYYRLQATPGRRLRFLLYLVRGKLAGVRGFLVQARGRLSATMQARP
jgi:hypothetical protein